MFSDLLASSCDFVYLPGDQLFSRIDFPDGTAAIRIDIASITTQIESLPSPNAAMVRQVEYIIRMSGLNLTADDFRDATTGEFDCTNEKLFSLL